jgi:pyruvate kinase
MRRQRNAKIVATLGPSSSTLELIRALFVAGADVFRLNFSHGTHDDHRRRIELIREVEREVGRPIGVLQDLQGPKIRIGSLKAGPVRIEEGAMIRFRLSEDPGDADTVPLPHPEVARNILPGHALMIDDGKLRLEVTAMETDGFIARVVVGGMLSDRKGVNLPDTDLPISPLTEKDRRDLEFGLSLGVDWIGLSFVQRPGDVIEAQGIVDGRAGVLAKVEKPAAIDRISDILPLVDALMVARGDLGVEIPSEDVPGKQKELIRLCRAAGKPVIVATQMLESMVKAPTPTRAEASDVATAIYDSADAVMLSAESASGDYPIEAVKMMDRIISHTETHRLYRSIIEAVQPSPERTVAHAVAAAAADIADQVDAVAIVAFTASGTTALRAARKRPRVPILSISPEVSVARRSALLWGTHSVVSRDVSSYDEMVESARLHVRGEGFAKPGETICVISGIPFGQRGTTNNVRVLTV